MVLRRFRQLRKSLTTTTLSSRAVPHKPYAPARAPSRLPSGGDPPPSVIICWRKARTAPCGAPRYIGSTGFYGHLPRRRSSAVAIDAGSIRNRDRLADRYRRGTASAPRRHSMPWVIKSSSISCLITSTVPAARSTTGQDRRFLQAAVRH